MNGWPTISFPFYFYPSFMQTTGYFCDSCVPIALDLTTELLSQLQTQRISSRKSMASSKHQIISRKDVKPSAYTAAIQAFNCRECADAYTAYNRYCLEHGRRLHRYSIPGRLAEVNHSRFCRTFSEDGCDPLDDMPAPAFWNSLRQMEEEHTKCHLCAAIYTAAFYRTGIPYAAWKDCLPLAYQYRKHSKECTVVKGRFEAQGAGQSHQRTPPRVRAPRQGYLESTLGGPQFAPDCDLTARITGLIASGNDASDIIRAIDSAINSNPNIAPRATLAQVWRNISSNDTADRAAALLTAVTMWYGDQHALDGYEAQMPRVRHNIARSWRATLKNAVEKIEDWVVSRQFLQPFRSALEVITLMLEAFAEGHQSVDSVLQMFKPIPLMAMLITYDGTPLGFTTLCLGILQLYGLLDADVFANMASVAVDALTAFAERVFGMLSPFGSDIQPQSTASFAVAFAAMIVVWIIGHLPSNIAMEIRRAATTATSLLAIIKVAKLAFDLARRYVTQQHVTALTDNVIALSVDVVKPACNSVATTRRQHLAQLKKLQEEINEHMIKVDYAPHLPTLKALNASIVALIIRLNQIEGQSTVRNPPVGIVLCGPPGIGKTTLATWLLDQISPDTVHSTFSLHVDHADAYSGEVTCLWDEFDTDPNQAFVEATIGIFNKTAYPLNCDLAENKGRVFSSRLVVMTTNTETPVQPNYPRAHAFYRRLIFYDVSCPALDRFLAENPGCDPPSTLFKDDFSHLKITRRPYLAYTARGETLDQTIAKPITCSPKAIVKEITTRMANFEAQAAPPQAIGVVVPRELAAEVRTALLTHYTTNNSFVKLVEARPGVPLTPADLHNTRGGHVIVTAECEDPLVKDWYVATQICETSTDLNTLIGLCPKMPHDMNQHFKTRLFRSIVHAGAIPPTALPPSHTYRCERAGDFLAVLRSVYGVQMLPIIARIAKRMTISSWSAFFASLADVTWGSSFHSYALHTPTGVFTVYTQDYMVVYSNVAVDHAVPPSAPPPPSSRSTWDLFKSLFKALCRIFVSHLNSAATMTATVYYARLAAATPQSNQRGMVRNYQAGVALSDEEYNTWREYSTRVDRSATVSDFIAARDALANNTAIAQDRIQALARWLQSRNNLLGTFQNQNADYIDYSRRIYRADGTFLGWALHIGNGRWAMNTHLVDEAANIDGYCFEVLKRGDDDITVVTSHSINATAQLGSGPPVRTWDARVTHSVYEHTLSNAQINARGWLCHVHGGTHQGDCGLPYYNAIGQVCGIHSGIYTGTRQSMISRFETKNPPPTTWRGVPVESSGMQCGPLRKGTAFSRSVAHPTPYAWETYEPAPYGAGDPRGCISQEKIMAAQLEPYMVAPAPLHPVVVDAAAYVQRHLAAITSFAPAPQVEPFSVALKRLDLSTSCGPFVPGCKGEYFLATPSGPLLKPGTALTRHLDSVISIASSGRPICHAYQLALKDELLPKRKIAENRKRLLWGTDVGLTTLACMVWGQLLDNLKSVVVASPIAVGCQMDSTFPATMIAQLQDKSTLCLDFKKWDSTMHPETIRLAVNILCDMVPDTPYTQSLRETLCSPPVGYFMDRKLYAQRGLPSGMPATSVVNSICHCIYFVSALWLTEDSCSIARTRDPLSANRIWVYGDDCVYALNPRTAANYHFFVESLKMLGLNPTAPDKTQNYRIDSDITFLKRDLVPLADIVAARLDLESILRQAVWVRCGSNNDHTVPRLPGDIEARTCQIKEAILALSLHGEEVFNKWVGLFYQTAAAEGLDVPQEPWDHLIEIYKSRYYTADPYSNILLAEGDMHTNVPANDFEFQNNPQQSGNSGNAGNIVATEGGFSASPVSPEQEMGGVQASYTPTTNSVAAAGGPVPESASLATLGAGMPSTLPPGIQGLFVAAARYTWNTQQPVRQQVGYLSLSPDANPFTAVLAQMYAGWSGGMLARIQVSGSGMYGGRLIASVLPPRIQPSNVSNPTAYPYVIIDARVAAPVELYIPDVRTSAFHTVGTDEPTCGIYLSVSAPLINPFSSGTNTTSAVEVTIYTTPAPDFFFSLLKEPTSSESQLASVLGNNTSDWWSNRVNAPISALVLASTARQSWNHYDCGGSTHGWGNARVNEPILIAIEEPSISNIAVGSLNEITFQKFDDAEEWPMPGVSPAMPDWVYTGNFTNSTNLGNDAVFGGTNSPIYSILPFSNDGYLTAYASATPVKLLWGIETSSTSGGSSSSTPVSFAGSAIIQVGNGYLYCQNAISSFGTGMKAMLCYSIPGGKNPYTQLQAADAPTVYPNVGNMIVTFQATISRLGTGTYGRQVGQTTMNCSQPLILSQRLREQTFPMNDSSIAVFRLTNGSSSFEIGLRPDGYLVTGGSTQSTIGINEDYEIAFSGFSSIDSRLMGPVVAGTRKK
uniref:Genome polyprotein n=1 Tax=Caliciviridae sp. TaxID=1916234 RepID=A0A2K9YNB3_9CALI|nr:polyprotein [Caliciviridae sp.]